MWSPTHVQVTVQKARGLLTKGKNGTNDAFVTIGLGKEKYQTSVKEKAPDTVEWHEKCELQIPKQGNTAEITLTALHHNFLGVDEFLGYISIPLAGLDVYDRPKNRWYTLKDKPGKDKKKSRGELEVKVAFIVKAGSLADLSKKEKHRSSLGQVSQAFSSSLISISSLDKRKGLKKLASKIGHKIGKSKNKEKVHDDSENSGHLNESQLSLDNKYQPSQQKAGDADPGVISEGESEDDFTLDDLSHKGSGCSLEMGESNSSPLQQSLKNLADHNYYTHSDVVVPPSKPPRTIIPTENKFDEWEQKLYGRHGKDGNNISPANTLKRRLNGKGTLVASASEDKISSVVSPYLNDAEGDNYTITTNAPKSEPTYSPQRMRHPVFLDNCVKEDHHNTDMRSSPTLSTSSKIPLERIIIGGEMERIFPQPTNVSRLSTEVIKKYEGKTREDLIEMVVDLQAQLFIQSRQQKDLEDYLDNLLLRVMETSPRILQNPYKKKS